MLISTVTKTAVGASTIVGTLSLVETTPVSYSTELNRTLFDKDITIKTLDDVELLERRGGCNISFIDSFKENRAYRAKEFYAKVQPNEKRDIKWNEKIIWAADYYKKRCTLGAFIPFAYNNDATQKFFIKEEE